MGVIFSVCLPVGCEGYRLRRLLQVLIALSLSCSRPQIEKIMTLIGAGIDFSRDQQYATPGRVPSLLPFHAIQHREIDRVISNSELNYH